MQEIIVGYKSM